MSNREDLDKALNGKDAGALHDEVQKGKSGANASDVSTASLSPAQNAQDSQVGKQQDKDEKENKESSSTALCVFRTLTDEADEVVETQGRVTLPSILGGDILGGRWFFKQVWYILMVVAMCILYVSNRYTCQQEMIETKQLNDTLLDRRYKALTRSSQLKEKTRRSRIEASLADTTLKTSVTPSFKLVVEE